MSLLLDTNVVSELRKVRAGKADPNVTRWADAVDPLDLFVSAITIQELETGVLLAGRRNAAHGALLRRWMDGHVLTAFANRILPVDMAVAQRSASLHVPVPRPLADSLIAGTALVHNMTMITRNTMDFEPMGVRLLNPWLKS